jgi:hypothetical protein
MVPDNRSQRSKGKDICSIEISTWFIAVSLDPWRLYSPLTSYCPPNHSSDKYVYFYYCVGAQLSFVGKAGMYALISANNVNATKDAVNLEPRKFQLEVLCL